MSKSSDSSVTRLSSRRTFISTAAVTSLAGMFFGAPAIAETDEWLAGRASGNLKKIVAKAA